MRVVGVQTRIVITAIVVVGTMIANAMEAEI
jgi:hypothetical protein